VSEIRRAVVKSYDAAAHKADVQIAGSLAVWLDAVRVATNIPAADVVTGRQCTVLFLDPSNQDDAVVITIQGATPSVPSGATVAASATVVSETTFGQASAPGAASPYSRGDHTHGTPADPIPAHVALSDPHTVYGALAQAETWAALQTFSAGLQLAAGQAIKDSGGTDRIIVATATPHVDIAGDLRVGATEGVLIGEVPGTSAADDDGIRLNATGSIPSALLTFVNGELLILGINDLNVGAYQAGRPGAQLRMDSRSGERTVTFRGYDGSTQVTMFQVPMHPDLSGGADDNEAFLRSAGDGTLFTLRGGTGSNSAIADVQAITANRPTHLRTIPKGSPSGERSTFDFYIDDVIADPANASLLRIVANSTPELIFRSEKAGTSTLAPMIWQMDDGATITEAFRVEIDAGVKFANTEIGFYGTAPIVQQTGVAVTAAAIHAALVNLGLITA